MSIGFDRAASFYDATRGLPPDVAARLTEILSAELVGKRPVLEIGIGTGRIAVPLHERAIDIVGIDLSRAMLDVLVGKLDRTMPLVQGDATRLPFRDDVFAAAIVSHVFHLIPDWEQAATELLRVLDHQGVILLAIDRDEESTWRKETRKYFRRMCRGNDRSSDYELRRRTAEDWLTERAATRRELEVIISHRTDSIAEFIDEMSSGRWSWTWSLPPEELQAAADATRTWASAEFEDLDEQRDSDGVVRWIALKFD